MSDKKSSHNEEQPVPSPFTAGAIDLYYQAIELLNGGGIGEGVRALQLLEQAYELEPDNVELQIGYVEAYNTLGIHASVRAHIEMAYKMTLSVFPTWPEELEWAELDNRPYLRAIQYKADWCWDQQDIEQAIDLYTLLLQLNPRDNQGVRYFLAAIYAGMTNAELDALWNRANDEQQHHLLEDLLESQNKQHNFWQEPEE